MDDRKIKKIIADLQRSGSFSDLELLQILKMLAGYKRSVRLIYSRNSRLKKSGRSHRQERHIVSDR